MDSPDSPSWASLNKREIETILSDLNAEQRKDLISAYGYGNAVRLLTELKDAKDEKGQGLYYIFKSLDNTQSINSKLSENNSIRVLENLKKISNNEDNIKNIQVEINKVSNDIKKNNKELDKLNSNLDKNSNNIEFNRKRIEFLSKNLNEIIDLKISLNNLKKKLNRGLATQSALTGLFQPYSVGKMNVTAAVGGYQSEKAIAVGSGYRFNDNLAAKVGLSKSLGGSAVSYNMGVNYEF
ncbi:ubiquitous surface protein A2H [Pasteurella canis]|nr:ubiquitous surface protein A2H [Pasteurella canis]